MLKQLLSDNRLFGAIVCIIVFIAGGLLYLQFAQRQTARDVQHTQELLQQRDNPQTGETAPQTEADGHFHADGTWHDERHEVETSDASLSTDTPQSAPTAVPRVPEVSRPSTSTIPTSSETTDTAEKRKLDPQTQLKVDQLYTDADLLSEESDIWSKKLYAEMQDIHRGYEELKSEHNSLWEHRDTMDKQEYDVLRKAWREKSHAAMARSVALRQAYRENRERRDEAMRLRAEARALGGDK